MKSQRIGMKISIKFVDLRLKTESVGRKPQNYDAQIHPPKTILQKIFGIENK